MIDHTGFTPSDYDRTKAFYTQALAPVGYTLLMELPASVTGSTDVAGFGEAPKPDFWLARATADKPAHSPTLHFAFRVNTRDAVDAFYQAALQAGGKDNGAPGIRAQYHPDYYGAFVIGPDGHNVEAVCHAPG